MKKKPMWMAIVGILAAATLIAVISANLRGGDKSPAVGTPAPDFTLNSQEGKPVSLHDFKGKWVVLYFYPKDYDHRLHDRSTQFPARPGQV
jgi:peroxiredoxin Q/BCP